MDASLPSAVNHPQRAGRAQTLALQGLVNRLIRGLLRTPLLCRAAGKRLITVYVVGRKSGRRYSIPVACTRRGQTLLIGTEFAWVRNLRSGEPVDIRWKGKRCSADVKVLAAEDAVVAHLAAMTRDNHQFAKFNRIGFDSDGNPNEIDLHLAWEAGTRGVELTPRRRK
jgi:deazaflavin-dependent oxidoreductase (nitroreductase family)